MKINIKRKGIVRVIDVGREIRGFLFPSWIELENEVVVLRKKVEVLKENPVIIKTDFGAIEKIGIDLKGKSLYLDFNQCLLRECDFKGIAGDALTTVFGNLNTFHQCNWVGEQENIKSDEK